MENIQLVGCGPVKVVWRHSRITDCGVIVKALREKEDHIGWFGVYGSGASLTECSCRTYGVVLWSKYESCRWSEMPERWWKTNIQEVLAKLCKMETPPQRIKESTTGESRSKESHPPNEDSGCLLEGHGDSQWEVVPFGEGETVTEIVGRFMEELPECNMVLY